MIAPSARHVPWLLVLMVVMLLPIARTGFGVQRTDDCADPAALRDLTGLPVTKSFEERFEMYDDDVPQWTVATLDVADRGVELKGVLARSFDGIDLYTRPPKVVLGTFEAGQQAIEEIEVDGVALTIQTIYDRNRMASYLFVYDGRPVRHPAWAQVQNAWEQLWGGTRPLSLLAAGGPMGPGRRQLATAKAREWLVAGYRHHRDACAAPVAASNP